MPKLFEDGQTRRAAKVVFVIFLVALAVAVAAVLIVLRLNSGYQ